MTTPRPIRIDLSAKDAPVARLLGVLTDALLASQSDRVLVSLGPNAKNGLVVGAFSKWIDRNERFLRTRAKAFAMVVPSLSVRIQWKLFFLLTQPVVRSSVHRTEAQALRWLENAGAR